MFEEHWIEICDIIPAKKANQNMPKCKKQKKKKMKWLLIIKERQQRAKDTEENLSNELAEFQRMRDKSSI